MNEGLHNLVTDWGGFEKFVAELHDTGDFEIQRNVELPARAGATYEIDVLLTSRAGPYIYRTIVSCKYWKTNVTRTQINDLIQAREQVGAQKAVCFTSSGYQDPSAVAAAREAGIDLFVVKDLLPEDWGSPGRIIKIVMQMAQTGAVVMPLPPVVPVGAALPSGWLVNVEPSEVEVLTLDGTADGTLAERAEKLAAKTYTSIRDRNCTYNGGEELAFMAAVNYTNLRFEGGPRLLRYGGYTAQVENLRCGIVVRVLQRPIVIDRGHVFDFAVVVEDYLNDRRTIVSRRPGAHPNWEPERRTVSMPLAAPNDVTHNTLLFAGRLTAPLPHSEVIRIMSQPDQSDAVVAAPDPNP